MAVLPADLLSPAGKIDTAFFPGEDSATLQERLQAYITEGEVRAADLSADVAAFDSAVILWSYYRAFEAVYLRLMSTPANISIAEEGSTSYTSQQIAMFGTTANQFKASFEAALVSPTVIEPMIPSGSVHNAYRF
jgi:hypothetical protein